jgi:hypothetical protein
MCSADSWTAKFETSAAALLLDVSSDPYGCFSPSIYETARLVSLGSWLDGHKERVRFLVESQHPDGSWGGPDGYGLVPTLSACEALFTCLWRADETGPIFDTGAVASAVDRGLRVLFGRLGLEDPYPVPDTVAVELIVPALTEEINAHLDRLASAPLTGLGAWRGAARLTAPDGVDEALLGRVRSAVRDDKSLPEKLWHSLEIAGGGVRGASFVRPQRGAVGCSAAATAAWLDPSASAGDHESVRYLNTMAVRSGGPVPVATPLPLFERAWVLAALASGGVAVPQRLLDDLHAAFGERGAAAGPGLPADSDDTATALYALALLGSPREPECLWAYRKDGYFSCFPDERTPSTSTNAHIVQALAACLGQRRWPRHAQYRRAISMVCEWLCSQQEADGAWWDKWHASPYYATACCVKALADGLGDDCATVLDKALEWVLGTQRRDGSWGRWAGTYEETAYAVQTLLQLPRSRTNTATAQAAARGCGFLMRWDGDQPHPQLWHDKDLYAPIRVIQAEGLAALHRAHTDPRVVALLRSDAATASLDCVAGDER